MRQVTLHLLILIAIAGAVFLTNLGKARLWDRDEPRNAGCAAEMVARGDWVVPTFNDELRPQKPVLLYWLIMSAYGLFGQSEFSARIWSAVLAIGTVAATYGIARRLTSMTIALLAGIVLSTNLMFAVAARAATPDSVLIFCGAMALLLYVLGTFAPRAETTAEAKLRIPGCWFPQNYLVVVAMYAMLGLGVLAKGPVGFLLPMAMIGMFMLIQRLPEQPPTRLARKLTEGRAKKFSRQTLLWISACLKPFHPAHFLKTLWFMRPITAAIVVLIIAAPWYVLVHERTDGDFTQLFFLGEHFGRATMAMENHGGGLWFYPLSMLVGFFPWSIFWLPVCVTLVLNRRIRGRLSAAEVLALCWIAIQVGAFSLAQTKLPSYVTPCYPAMAILTAICLVGWATRESAISTKWICAAFGGLIIGGILIETGLGIAISMYFPSRMWLLLIGVIPVVGGIVGIWQLLNSQTQRVTFTVVTTSFLFCFVLFGFGTVAIDSEQNSQLVLDQIASANKHEIVASYRSLESSWVYYGGKPIYECSLGAVPATSQTLAKTDWWKAKPWLTPEELQSQYPSIMFITTDKHLPELMQRLPNEFEVVQKAGYFLRDRQIVLLRRRSNVVASDQIDIRYR